MRRFDSARRSARGSRVEGGPDDVGLVLEAVGRGRGSASSSRSRRGRRGWWPSRSIQREMARRTRGSLPGAGLEDVEGEAEHAALHLGVEDVVAEVPPS